LTEILGRYLEVEQNICLKKVEGSDDYFCECVCFRIFKICPWKLTEMVVR